MTRLNSRKIEYLILLACLMATYLVASNYDIFEFLVELSRKYEKYEVDEIITVSMVFLFYLSVFVYRLLRVEQDYSMKIAMKNEQLTKHSMR